MSCDGCVGAADVCEACAAGFYEIVNTTQCESTCPDGTAEDNSTGTCTCSSSCATCTGTTTFCTTC